MDWSKYKALKSDSKASMSKEAKGDEEVVVLSQKHWNPDNGEALDDSKSEMHLPALEAQKARYDAQVASAQAQSDGLKAAIAEHKKL